MDDISALQHTIQQQNQRINSLEELLRRNEGSLGAALNRVKDVELGMNSFHKLIQQTVNENSALGKELANTRQRADLVDRAWRTHVQQSETAIWNEIRQNNSNMNKHGSGSQDPTVSRMMQELNQQRSQLSDVEIGLNRLTDAQANDTNAIRICEQHLQNAEGQISELMSLQREGAKDTIRRFETSFRDIGQHRTDTDRAVNNLKQQVDKQLRDTSITLEQQSSIVNTLQQEIGSSVRSIREDVANGITQLSQSARDNESATKTLEQILRAEVQTRAQGVEQLSRRVGTIEQQVGSKLSMVQMHQNDIGRLWDAMRTAQHSRQQAERLEGVLSSVDGGAGAGAGHHHHQNSGGNNNNAAIEQVRDLEASTAERFDLVDSHVLQLAETLKRAHSGVEEQVDSLASRFGRMEMRLEKVAARKEEQEQATAKLLMNLRNNSGRNDDDEGNSSSKLPTETIVKEVVDTRLRVDRIDGIVEEVKFDVADLLDAISAETSDLNRRLEVVERQQGSSGGNNNSNSNSRPPQSPPNTNNNNQNRFSNMNLRSSSDNNNNNDNLSRPMSSNNNHQNVISTSARSNNNQQLDARSNAELLAEFAGNGAEVIDTSASPSMN